jgi:carbonic anhydrase
MGDDLTKSAGSCANATAPINITKNTDNICSLKCSYTFSYGTTNLLIQNNKDNLSWLVDDTNIAPVTYNDKSYNVREVRLYYPSLHTYTGERAAAELIISHANTMSTGNLLVCIPIIASSTSTAECLAYFDLILAEVAKTAPTLGTQTVLNLPTFSLDKFVPMKPYFSYSGSLPYTPCNGEYDYVVFNLDNAITMSPEALNVLKQVTGEQKTNISQINENGLFYNAAGPVPPTKGQIYIDCQPTGADGEILVQVKPMSGGILNNDMFKKLVSYTLFKILIGALIMIVIWRLATKAIKGIASKTNEVVSLAKEVKRGVSSN